MLKNRGKIAVYVLALVHYSHTMVLLSANIEDLRNLARRFVPDTLVTQLTEFIQKYSAKTPESKMSEENELNLKKYMDLKLSDDEYSFNDIPENLPKLHQMTRMHKPEHQEGEKLEQQSYQQRTKPEKEISTYLKDAQEDIEEEFKKHQKYKEETLRTYQEHSQKEKKNIRNQVNNNIPSEDLKERKQGKKNVKSYNNKDDFVTAKSIVNEKFPPTVENHFEPLAKINKTHGVRTSQTAYPTRTGFTGRMQHEYYDKPRKGQKTLPSPPNTEARDEFQNLEIPIQQLLQIIQDLKDEEEKAKKQKQNEKPNEKYERYNKEENVMNRQNKNQTPGVKKHRTMRMMQEIANLDEDKLFALKDAVDKLEQHTYELYNVVAHRTISPGVTDSFRLQQLKNSRRVNFGLTDFVGMETTSNSIVNK